MKRIILNLLVVFLIISQSFVSPVFANDEETNNDFPETEEVIEEDKQDEDIEESPVEEEPVQEGEQIEQDEPSEEENKQETEEPLLLNGVSNGTTVPADLTVSEDTDGNIIISTSDNTYLEALAVLDDYSSTRVEIWKYMEYSKYFYNYTNPYTSETIYGLNYDEVNSNISIDNQKIKNNNIPNGESSITIKVNGYEDYSGEITLTKACVSAPDDVVIKTNSNGDVTITSDNTEWISAVSQMGYIEVWQNLSMIYYAQPIRDVEAFLVSNEGKTVTIKNDQFNKNGAKSNLADGEYTFNVTAQGSGYGTLSYPDTVIVAKGSIPNDIEVTSDENGIVITSDDTYWLDGILAKKSKTNYGYIRLEPQNDNYLASIFSNADANNLQYTKEGNKVIIPIDKVYKNRVSTAASYSVVIKSCGFDEYTIPYTDVTIVGLKSKDDLNNPVSFKQEDGKLIILCDDKDYLEGLADPTAKFISGQNLTGSLGWHYEVYPAISGQQITYDSVNEYAYIDYEVYKNFLTKNKYKLDESCAMYIMPYGYNTSREDYKLDLINCPKPEVMIGATKQLSFAEYDETYVTWESLNENIATVDENGLLKGVKAGNARIIARYLEGSDVSYDYLDIKVTTNSKVAIKMATEDKNTIADVNTPEQLNVTVTGYTLLDSDDIIYSSNNDEIASVDTDGLITFNKPGIVTISASALGKTASLKISVYGIDKAKKVTLTYSGSTLEAGEELSDSLEMKAGGEDLPSGTELTYTSSNVNVATIGENGVITAVGKGTATITVALKDDPAKRKATCKVTVIDRIIDSISKDLNVESNPAIVVEKSIDPSTDAETRLVHVSYGLLNKSKLFIDLTDSGHGENAISPEYVTPTNVTYKSNNTSVATVDSKGYVSFKKAGIATITVTIASNPKEHAVVSRDIKFEVVDYTPRIETNKFILEKYEDYDTNGYPSYNLHKILSTDADLITDYKITESKGEDSLYFDLEYHGENANIDTFEIHFKENVQSTISAKSFTQLLQFSTDNGTSWYKYKVTVQVKATLPTVSPKVAGFYNTFTNENTLELVNTVKNGTIDDIEFVGDWADYDSSTGKITAITYDAKGKPVTSGKVKYTFNGLTEVGVVEKTVKLSIKTTKPTVKLETSTYTLYVPTGAIGNKDIEVKLIDGNKNVIEEGTVELNDALSIVGSSLSNSDISDGILEVSIPVEGLKSGKVVLNYKGDGWADSSVIPLTINIKTATALPKAKLSATSITLDNNFANTEDVDITLPGSSEEITEVDFEVSPITGLTADYANGVISLESSQVGTYKVICTPKINGNELSPLTLTVKVANTIPTVKLDTTSVRFNQNFNEKISIDLSLTNNKYNVGIDSLLVENKADASGRPLDDPQSPLVVEGGLEGGKLKLYFDNTHGYVSGKYKIAVTPSFIDVNNNPITGASIIMSVELYRKDPEASITVKSAINPLDKSSSSLVTVKLTNLIDDITGIEIDDDYDDLFEVVEDEGNLKLKIVDGADLSEYKDGTYIVDAKVKTDLITDGIDTTLSIKLARKVPTVKLSTSVVNVYDVTLANDTVLGEVDLEFDDINYEIDSATILTENSAFEVSYNSDLKKFVVKMKDNSQVKSGASVAFSAKLSWKNDFNETKTTTVKFNVKDASYLVKTS